MFLTLMQRVQKQLEKELPFVVYRKPRQKKVKGIFQSTDHIHLISNYSGTGFVFAPFDSLKKTILIPLDEVLVADDFEPSNSAIINKIDVDTSQKEAHMVLVEKAIGEIKKQRFQKVVLSRKIAVGTDANVTALFQRLLSLYEAAFCYLWYHPKVGLWLGATPEILLRTENRQFTTMSLAGTQAFVQNESPIWKKKELQEQMVVTQYIEAALKDKVKGLHTSELETIRAGNLLHLRTKLTGRFTTDLGEIINALHPTPAVCGLPMSATKKFILSNENYDREFYTGFLGELNFKEGRQRTSNGKNQENQAYRMIKNKSELYVNLRCMKLEDKTVAIFVGGGITAASVPKKEWQETVGKSETMLRILS